MLTLGSFRGRPLAVVTSIILMMPVTAWAVGSTPVTVVNPADIAKAQGIQHPTQFVVTCSPVTQCGTTFSVPPGQRLVIEYASATCVFSPASAHMIQVGLQTVVGGSGVIHLLNLTDHVGVGGIVTLGHLVRLYADPSTSVSGFVVSDGNSATCFFNVSGQLIDVP